MVTHNAEDDEKAQKAFLFLCLITKDWGTFSNHTRTCEHTHTAQKRISPFTVRSQASTYPSIEKHCSTHIFRLSLLTIFHFLPYPFVAPPYLYMGRKRDKERKIGKKVKFFLQPPLILTTTPYRINRKYFLST